MKEDIHIQFNRIVFRSDKRQPITVKKAVENIVEHTMGQASFDNVLFALTVTGVVEPGPEAGQTVRTAMNDFGCHTKDSRFEDRQKSA